MHKSLGAQTLVFPTPTWIVGSYDREGRPNGMAAAWGGICCSDPPCVAVSLRKATYSYGSLMLRRAFTISVPSETQAKQADYFGIASGRDVDKFVALNLTPVRSDLVDAPYIKEFPLVLECEVIHVFELGLHTQFVGRILDVKAEESILGPDGWPDLEKLRPIVFSPGNHRYYGVGRLLGNAFSIGKDV